jgi:hypothetical protein
MNLAAANTGALMTLENYSLKKSRAKALRYEKSIYSRQYRHRKLFGVKALVAQNACGLFSCHQVWLITIGREAGLKLHLY